MTNIKLGATPLKICEDRYVLQLSKDKLRLILALHDAEEFQPADWPQVVEIVKAAGVVHGFRDIVLEWKDGKALIAMGTPARHGENAKVKPLVRPAVIPATGDSLKERMNFRELGVIVNVPEEQLLLEKIPATAGVPGRNIFGEEIAARDGKDVTIRCGRGVVLSEDGLRVTSTVKGKFVMDEGKPAVYEEHLVNSDVDMSVGNITFSGKRLLISGQVLPGFKVKCMGNIEVGGGVNNAEIVVGGDLKIVGGLIGENCSVRVWGDMEVDFCENTGLIETRGIMTIGDFIVQGNVRVEKDLKALRGKGAIIGGKYILGGSLYVRELGSDGEVQTEVVVGLNPGLEMKKKKIDEAKAIWPPRLTEMLKDISALSAMKKEDGQKFSAENEARLQKLNTLLPKVMEANNQLADLEERLDAEIEESATQCLYVFGKLYPGLHVTIGKISRVLNTPEEGVVVWFNKEKRAIHVRGMTPEERAMADNGA